MKAQSEAMNIIVLLQVVLVVLKLCGAVTCSWLWVLTPIWLPAAFALLAGAVLWVYLKFTE